MQLNPKRELCNPEATKLRFFSLAFSDDPGNTEFSIVLLNVNLLRKTELSRVEFGTLRLSF